MCATAHAHKRACKSQIKTQHGFIATAFNAYNSKHTHTHTVQHRNNMLLLCHPSSRTRRVGLAREFVHPERRTTEPNRTQRYTDHIGDLICVRCVCESIYLSRIIMHRGARSTHTRGLPSRSKRQTLLCSFSCVAALCSRCV